MTNDTNRSLSGAEMHTMPAHIRAVIASDPAIQTLWDALTPLAQNEWLCWLTYPKKPETRTKHLSRLTTDLQSGKKRPCCWPGCPHRRPSAKKWLS